MVSVCVPDLGGTVKPQFKTVYNVPEIKSTYLYVIGLCIVKYPVPELHNTFNHLVLTSKVQINDFMPALNLFVYSNYKRSFYYS